MINVKLYFSLVLMVLAGLIIVKLAGAIVHYFFWPLILGLLIGITVFVFRRH